MAKKYKCPYCEERHEREKLITHIEDDHEDLIPENETPTQIVFNSINKKTHGTCVVCKKPTKWNEKAGRYDRLCENPKCREKLRQDFKTNSLSKHGTYNFTADPKFQEKMLKGRKISSTYKFTDGGKVDYVGSYEKKFLEFVDKVMEIDSKDIIGPGPIIEYEYNGEIHHWITDFYYVPGNLVLDIKDGGKNPNTRPMESYREKQVAKEASIKRMKKYNYLRLTDNNFGQFLEVLADLKFMALDIKETQLINRINESAINESVFVSKDDIYWNFDKFKNDKSNILLITGLSGSGKSTLGRQLSKKYNAEYIELDMISDVNKKNKHPLLQEWMDSISDEELIELKKDPWYGESVPNFINYCIKYAKANKNKKFIIEGTQIYEVYKEQAKQYPLIIKGTSVVKSFIQKVKRDKFTYKDFLSDGSNVLGWLIKSDSDLNKIRKSLSESAINESDDESFIDKNHKQKGAKKLSEFRLVKTQNNDEGKSYNLKWYDGNKLVAKVTTDSIPASDGYRWFGSLQVSKQYRGYGLSNQILKLIISKYKAGALAVYKDNEIAYNLYKRHGFKIDKNRNNKDYYYMYLEKNKENVVNELSAAMSTLPPMYSSDASVLISVDNRGDERIALSSLDFNDKLLLDDELDGIIKITKEKFKEKYTIKEQFLVKKDEAYYNLLKAFKNKDACIYEGIYRNLSSFDTVLTENQIYFDNKFIKVEKDKVLEEMTNRLSKVNESIFVIGESTFIRNDKLELDSMTESDFNINEFYNELKVELEGYHDGVYMITPSTDKEDLDDQYHKFNAQNDDQKDKADTRSFALYGMSNYDHYHILLSKLKKGTEDDELNGLEYNPHDEEVVKESTKIPVDLSKEFNSKNSTEVCEKIKIAKEFNTHTLGRAIVYPTENAKELESLYMKYMALNKDDKASSDNKSKELFGKTNREIYQFIQDNIIKPKNDKIEGTHSVDDKKIEASTYRNSIFSNDTPILSPKELNIEVHEDYSCFNDEDGKVIKAWRESYTLLGQGMIEEKYRSLNLKRINILRKCIYQNNIEGIIQCGWIPGIEFNSENRVKATRMINEKMEVFNIIDYDSIEESFFIDKDDFYCNFNKWENNESNILFITGFSGSGKSTLAKELSKKYRCNHFELDAIQFFEDMTNSQLKNMEPGLYDFLNTYKDIHKKLINKKIQTYEEEIELYETYIKFLINWCKKRKPERFIIEGLQLYEIFNNKNPQSFYKGMPIIIKGTSGLKSSIRGAKRNSRESGKSLLKELPPMIGWAIKDNKSLEKFKKSVLESYIEESASKSVNGKRAVSIILVSNDSLIANAIKTVQKCEWSHASISLDDDLSRIYSFAMNSGFNGLTYESLKKYIKDGTQKLGVYTFLVSDKVYKKLESIIENFNLHIKDTRYSLLNLLAIPLNIPVDLNMTMVCSEFVDKLLKMVNINTNNKHSALVTPKDFGSLKFNNPKIVEMYYGDPKKCNIKQLQRKIDKLKKSNFPIYEEIEYNEESFVNETKVRENMPKKCTKCGSTNIGTFLAGEPIYKCKDCGEYLGTVPFLTNESYIQEAKSFPIQFDSDGNLIIKNIRKIDFEQEYANSHRLLIEYNKTKSYEQMKFELAKMQFLITLMEKKIYDKDKPNKDLIKVRARYLNDFKKYLKIVVANDPSFNFGEYYEQSPFNDAMIQIDKNTLKYGWKALKYIITK